MNLILFFLRVYTKMANMKLPTEVQEGLENLNNLDPTLKQSLLDALKNAKPALNHQDLVKAAVTKVEIGETTLTEIIRSLLSIHSFQRAIELSPKEASIRIINSEDFPVSDIEDDRNKFATCLENFLEVDSLKITAKAVSMYTDHPQVFLSGQIMSDIRPVFTDELSDDLMGAMIFHNLKITYRRDDEFFDFLVALDGSDLKKLRKALDRAEAKQRTLEGILKKSGFPYLSSTEVNANGD